MAPQSALIGRTVTPNGPRFLRLRTEKCMTIEEFAEKADCSSKTINRLERSRPALLKTIRGIAECFEVPISELVAAPQPLLDEAEPHQRDPNAPITDNDRLFVVVRLLIPYEDFDECDQLLDFLTDFVKRIGSIARIEFQLVRNGSTLIDLRVTIADAIRALDAMSRGDLDELRVDAIGVFMDHTDPTYGHNVFPLLHDYVLRRVADTYHAYPPISHVQMSPFNDASLSTLTGWTFLNTGLEQRLRQKDKQIIADDKAVNTLPANHEFPES